MSDVNHHINDQKIIARLTSQKAQENSERFLYTTQFTGISLPLIKHCPQIMTTFGTKQLRSTVASMQLLLEKFKLKNHCD